MSWYAILPFLLGGLAAMAHRFYRKRQWERTPLRPNCLLTRYPIVFLKQRQFPNLVGTRDPICSGLAAHGYETFEVQVTSRSTPEQAASLHKLFSRLELKFGRAHVFFDAGLESKIIDIQTSHAHVIASSQKLTAKSLPTYLDRAISLAENDIQCSH